jgi:hypothetical protein
MARRIQFWLQYSTKFWVTWDPWPSVIRSHHCPPAGSLVYRSNICSSHTMPISSFEQSDRGEVIESMYVYSSIFSTQADCMLSEAASKTIPGGSTPPSAQIQAMIVIHFRDLLVRACLTSPRSHILLLNTRFVLMGLPSTEPFTSILYVRQGGILYSATFGAESQNISFNPNPRISHFSWALHAAGPFGYKTHGFPVDKLSIPAPRDPFSCHRRCKSLYHLSYRWKRLHSKVVNILHKLCLFMWWILC